MTPFLDLIHGGIVAIFRGEADAARLIETCDALVEAGVGAVEITLDSPGAIVAEGPSTAVVSIGDDGVIALHDGEIVSASSEHAEVVDRVGAGDALAAGVIDGWLDGDVAAGVRRGSHLAALALAQRGDMVHLAPADLTETRAPSSAESGIVR